ncbi:MAG: hypothetical protein M3081_18865 [Gemmatimonadota bacterium]|nr:hypothetical protein [Gemmatimonadota bacterium]
MTSDFDHPSRRSFVSRVGRFASVAALAAWVNPRRTEMLAQSNTPRPASGSDWDLSWVDRLANATDRAVFDWPSIGDPDDGIVPAIAARYLDNCAAAYGPSRYDARVVLNVRTQAVPVALNDAAWERYALGTEYSVKDPVSKQPAVRNPFWHRNPDPRNAMLSPTLEELVGRGAIILVCDFALGHLAKRLATKAGRDAESVHRDLRGAFVPASFAVPSGIFGLAKSQNAGCAFVRM